LRRRRIDGEQIRPDELAREVLRRGCRIAQGREIGSARRRDGTAKYQAQGFRGHRYHTHKLLGLSKYSTSETLGLILPYCAYAKVFRIAGVTSFLGYSAALLADVDLVPPFLEHDDQSHGGRIGLRRVDNRDVWLALAAVVPEQPD